MLLVCLVFALLLSQPAQVHAGAQDDACVAQMSDDEVAEQLGFVEHSLAQQRAGSIMWWSGWTAFNLLNLGIGIERYVRSNRRLAEDSWLVSIIGAGAFVAQVSVLPMPGMYAHRRLARLPGGTPEERREKLRRGLGLLDKGATIERTNSNWVAHVAGFAYATASSGYVWARNTHAPPHRLALAVSLQFATSVAFAELTFWTVPRKARRDQEHVRNAVCRRAAGTAPHGTPQASKDRAWLGLRFFPGEVALGARF